MTLGEYLRAVRLEKGMQQNEVAEKAGVDKATLFKIEHGEVDPRYTTYHNICEVLGISVLDVNVIKHKCCVCGREAKVVKGVELASGKFKRYWFCEECVE